MPEWRECELATDGRNEHGALVLRYCAVGVRNSATAKACPTCLVPAVVEALEEAIDAAVQESRVDCKAVGHNHCPNCSRSVDGKCPFAERIWKWQAALALIAKAKGEAE